MAEALGLESADFEAMTEGFRFIAADEANKLLAPTDGGVAKLFADASDIWLKAEVIEKSVPNVNRVTNRFVEIYLQPK